MRKRRIQMRKRKRQKKKTKKKEMMMKKKMMIASTRTKPGIRTMTSYDIVILSTKMYFQDNQKPKCRCREGCHPRGRWPDDAVIKEEEDRWGAIGSRTPRACHYCGE